MKSKQILRFYFIVIACVSIFVFVGSLCAGNFIKNFDKDNDGQVSKEEFPGPDTVFEDHDKNQDGYLDESEAPKGRPTGGKKGGGFIKNFDKDNDGQVSKEEFPGPDTVFEDHDKNQDGYLDESEAPKRPPAGGKKGGGSDGKKGGGFIKNFDKDNDGQVSKEEFPGPDTVFEDHDKNQDGYLDESEAPKRPPAGKEKGD